MTKQSQEVLETALALPEVERAEIAASLIRSLDDETDEDADAAWANEIQQRLDSIDRGEVRLIPWDDVMEELKREKMDSLALEFHPGARFDVLEAHTWYAERSESAADAFLTELKRAGIAIQRSPLLLGKYLRGTRRYLMKRFPYIVVYRVAENRIEIIAVAHGRRRPGFWKERLKPRSQ